jgi:hypothetical protein
MLMAYSIRREQLGDAQLGLVVVLAGIQHAPEDRRKAGGRRRLCSLKALFSKTNQPNESVGWKEGENSPIAASAVSSAGTTSPGVFNS